MGLHVHAQAGTAGGGRSHWVLSGGIAANDTLVEGVSFGLVFDPRVALSPWLMLGSKSLVNFSTDDILTLETQAFLRWNFLTLGTSPNELSLFAQGGVGLLAAFRDNDATRSRGSILLDASAGITIPLSERWQIEPSVRFGYPFIAGAALTAGVRFPLPRREAPPQIWTVTEYVEIIRTLPPVEVIRELPPVEIVRSVFVAQIEYVMFGPDMTRYNDGIDADGRALNDLVIDQVARVLRENPEFVVRIEGHANPVTHAPGETEELVALSEARANEVARRLRERGVDDDRIVVAALGGTRIIAGDHDHWNVNRRVELMVKRIDT